MASSALPDDAEDAPAAFRVPYPTPPKEHTSRERARRASKDSVTLIDETVPPLLAPSGSNGSDGSTAPPSPQISLPGEPYTPPETPMLPCDLKGNSLVQNSALLGVGGDAAKANQHARRTVPPAPVRTGWTPPTTSVESFGAPNDFSGAATAYANAPPPPHDDDDDEGRRRSVYLPIEGETVHSPWSFDNADLIAPPKSPSHIHPSYGLPPLPDVYQRADISAGTRVPLVPPFPHAHKVSDPPTPYLATSAPLAVLLRNASLRRMLDSSASWLAFYFLANLGLTLYNKMVLVRFPFPWTLTAVHTLCGAIGAQTALSNNLFTQARLTRRESVTLVAFSTLYTVNIAVSNLSLHLVTVPFHQVVRAMTPLFTIAVSVAFLRKVYSSRTYLSLVPIIAGVAFATYGDYYFTWWGLVLTLFGTLLAALKTVLTNIIQVGRLKLHPLDLLLRMSPLAFIQCVVFAWYTGELERVRAYGALEMTRGKGMALAVNGVLAFCLNVVSFAANKKTSPLTMTVAANVKQVLTILLSVMIFNLRVTGMNLLGIILTLGGGMLYAGIELQEKRRKARRLPIASPLSTVATLHT